MDTSGGGGGHSYPAAPPGFHRGMRKALESREGLKLFLVAKQTTVLCALGASAVFSLYRHILAFFSEEHNACSQAFEPAWFRRIFCVQILNQESDQVESDNSLTPLIV